ncbi:single-stranded DNA-binding protein [Cupriavidus plantarum]|uniref:single-stranded DNA-binding protein n=1 Tax=Cupriavidus plantarum TaxID=942865 RepID=UPI000EB4D395|nr:single-stranded DNA-binding protein [Cupriavidus plantarum]RLK36111.1 single-stranded DNA-binding protein [Cupriavidus plantarum]
MIDGLVAGKLHGKPIERAGQGGKYFVTARVRAALGTGDALFINVITFSDSTKAALLALDDGDAVALSGALTPKVWTDNQGVSRPAVDMVANSVLTAYHMRRKRKAVHPPLFASNASDITDDADL